MTKLRPSYILLFLLLLPFGCQKDNSGPLVLGTQVCFKTQHHERGLRDITVYLYNTIDFPGYEMSETYDTLLVSNSFAEVCFPAVSLGNHWAVGYGYDSLLHEPVRGSLPFEIVSLHQPWDTILYVSEY